MLEVELAFADCQATYNPFYSTLASKSWRISNVKSYPGPADILEFTKSAKEKVKFADSAIPWTVFVRTDLGNSTIKLIKMLEELKFYNKSDTALVSNGEVSAAPFNASHSLTSTYLGSTTIVLIDPFTSCALT